MCYAHFLESNAVENTIHEEQFEAEIQEAFKSNKDRPDLFVKHLQDVLQMSEFDILKELGRFRNDLLLKFSIYITPKEQ